MARKKAGVTPKLTDPERDLLADMESGYQLETDSLGGNPVLRHLKDGEVVRPVSVNRSTIKAMQERGLIRPAKGPDQLTVVWRQTDNRRRTR
jgi:hypothetical protein